MKKDCVVGLIGYPSSGKDMVAQMLVEQHGFTRVAFGDAIKDMMLLLDDRYEGSRARLEYHKALGETDPLRTRTRLQELGEFARGVYPRFWVDAAARVVPLDGPVVFSDIRYPNELQWVRDDPDLPGARGDGVIIGIDRPNYGAINDHVSERNTGDLMLDADAILVNDSTPEALIAELLEFV